MNSYRKFRGPRPRSGLPRCGFFSALACRSSGCAAGSPGSRSRVSGGRLTGSWSEPARNIACLPACEPQHLAPPPAGRSVPAAAAAAFRVGSSWMRSAPPFLVPAIRNGRNAVTDTTCRDRYIAPFINSFTGIVGIRDDIVFREAPGHTPTRPGRTPGFLWFAIRSAAPHIFFNRHRPPAG